MQSSYFRHLPVPKEAVLNTEDEKTGVFAYLFLPNSSESRFAAIKMKASPTGGSV